MILETGKTYRYVKANNYTFLDPLWIYPVENNIINVEYNKLYIDINDYFLIIKTSETDNFVHFKKLKTMKNYIGYQAVYCLSKCGYFGFFNSISDNLTVRKYLQL